MYGESLAHFLVFTRKWDKEIRGGCVAKTLEVTCSARYMNGIT